jgi:hypothetical protein
MGCPPSKEPSAVLPCAVPIASIARGSFLNLVTLGFGVFFVIVLGLAASNARALAMMLITLASLCSGDIEAMGSPTSICGFSRLCFPRPIYGLSHLFEKERYPADEDIPNSGHDTSFTFPASH